MDGDIEVRRRGGIYSEKVRRSDTDYGEWNIVD
jgi:hypothetical protein